MKFTNESLAKYERYFTDPKVILAILFAVCAFSVGVGLLMMGASAPPAGRDASDAAGGELLLGRAPAAHSGPDARPVIPESGVSRLPALSSGSDADQAASASSVDSLRAASRTQDKLAAGGIAEADNKGESVADGSKAAQQLKAAGESGDQGFNVGPAAPGPGGGVAGLAAGGKGGAQRKPAAGAAAATAGPVRGPSEGFFGGMMRRFRSLLRGGAEGGLGRGVFREAALNPGGNPFGASAAARGGGSVSPDGPSMARASAGGAQGGGEGGAPAAAMPGGGRVSAGGSVGGAGMGQGALPPAASNGAQNDAPAATNQRISDQRAALGSEKKDELELDQKALSILGDMTGKYDAVYAVGYNSLKAFDDRLAADAGYFSNLRMTLPDLTVAAQITELRDVVDDSKDGIMALEKQNLDQLNVAAACVGLLAARTDIPSGDADIQCLQAAESGLGGRSPQVAKLGWLKGMLFDDHAAGPSKTRLIDAELRLEADQHCPGATEIERGRCGAARSAQSYFNDSKTCYAEELFDGPSSALGALAKTPWEHARQPQALELHAPQRGHWTRMRAIESGIGALKLPDGARTGFDLSDAVNALDYSAAAWENLPDPAQSGDVKAVKLAEGARNGLLALGDMRDADQRLGEMTGAPPDKPERRR